MARPPAPTPSTSQPPSPSSRGAIHLHGLHPPVRLLHRDPEVVHAPADVPMPPGAEKQGEEPERNMGSLGLPSEHGFVHRPL